jgi:hypothetical protein
LPFVKSSTPLFVSTHVIFFLPVIEIDCSNIKIYLLRLNKCQLCVCIYFNHVYWCKSFFTWWPAGLRFLLCGSNCLFIFLFSGPLRRTKKERLWSPSHIDNFIRDVSIAWPVRYHNQPHSAVLHSTKTPSLNDKRFLTHLVILLFVPHTVHDK